MALPSVVYLGRPRTASPCPAPPGGPSPPGPRNRRRQRSRRAGQRAGRARARARCSGTPAAGAGAATRRPGVVGVVPRFGPWKRLSPLSLTPSECHRRPGCRPGAGRERTGRGPAGAWGRARGEEKAKEKAVLADLWVRPPRTRAGRLLYAITARVPRSEFLQTEACGAGLALGDWVALGGPRPRRGTAKETE